MSEQTMSFLLSFLEVMSGLFIFFAGLIVFVVLTLYVIDHTQTKNAIRRNYPVIGRFRSLFQQLGEFFRQYFFAMDREELPFNRAQRTWCYTAAADTGGLVAFGSTRDLRPVGTVIFVNCPFPALGEDAVPAEAVTIGAGCDRPYSTKSIFNISGMSFGAISRPAVIALSKGAHEAGCWLNTGEGGLAPYHLDGDADLVFQIGTAKNGVRDQDGNLNDDKLREVAAHDQVKMFEVKLSQGAKPGKGGILPGVKVTDEIARIRGIRAGEDAISPNRHTDINSIEQLLDVLNHIREVTGKPVGFKTVIGAYGWIERLCAEINRRGAHWAPDFITIDGGDGGTGAAPMALIDDVGLPLRESLPLLVDTIAAAGLSERIRVIASGKAVTPSEVAWALCVGADFVVSARGFMFSLGCIQALQCNRNTCPTGITTHKKSLQRGLVAREKAVSVANYHKNMINEVGIIAHSCGVTSPRALRRYHARMVTETGRSVPVSDLYPDVQQKMKEVENAPVEQTS